MEKKLLEHFTKNNCKGQTDEKLIRRKSDKLYVKRKGQTRLSGGVLWKKVFRKYAANWQENTNAKVWFQCNFIEIILRHGCSPINLLHITKTPFLKNTSEWLLMKGYDNLFNSCICNKSLYKVNYVWEPYARSKSKRKNKQKNKKNTKQNIKNKTNLIFSLWNKMWFEKCNSLFSQFKVGC